MTFLSLDGISKSYGETVALDAIRMEIAAGGRTAIVGPSGSGKTTLLRIIAGFETPDRGSLVLDGRMLADDATFVPAHRRGIGIVSQDGALFPHLSVAENIGFGFERRAADREKRVLELLDMVELDRGMLTRRPHQLSGGQQQRVALARALITDPEALLLDEPLSALDPFLKIRMRAELKKLQTSLGITFVHVTHSQEEAMALADLIVVMNDGRIEQAAHPRVVFEKPATAFVAKFMGDHNVISGRVAQSSGDKLMLSVPAGGDFLATDDGAAGLTDTADIAIRTDHVRIGQPSEKGLGFTGSVSNVEYRGSSVKLSVNGAGIEDFTAILTDAEFFANPVKVGEAIPLSWGREDAIVLGRLKN